MSALIAVQKAIVQALNANASLTALIGAGKIFDDVPPGVRPPYVLLSGAASDDWSTATEAGAEHRLELEVWSDQRGRRSAALIAEACIGAAEGIGAIEAPWRLVNLRHLSTAHSRDPQTEYHRALIRFRAVTETA
jgi:hypothetical protein